MKQYKLVIIGDLNGDGQMNDIDLIKLKYYSDDNNYEWFELYPDNDKYALTIMFDNYNNLL